MGQCGIGDSFEQLTSRLLMKDKIKLISCGEAHSIIVKENGDVLVSGNNAMGQLGLGTITNERSFKLLKNYKDVKDVCCGGDHSMILYGNNLEVFGRFFDLFLFKKYFFIFF